MSPQNVKDFFKTFSKFKQQTGIARNSLRYWINNGYVPFVYQKKIEKVTGGALVAVFDEKELESK